MCRIMDEAIQEKIIKIAINLLQMGTLTHEQVAEATGLALDKVKQLAGQAAS